MTVAAYRAWCVTWEDDEQEDGSDLVAYDPIAYILSVAPIKTKRRAILVPFYNLESPSEAAEAYAEYIHNHRDGWEGGWPLTIRVRSPDGTEQDFCVEREMEPKFSAAEVKASS